MAHKRMKVEADLARLAKEFRLKSGKTKIEAAAELGVRRSTVQLAEENPEQSLHRLRIRMIEKYSPFTVVGPVYVLKRK
jgi:DNA-binding XRE family transcriptional regulator